MPLWPVRFDANEWYILLNSILGYTWVFFVPKRYPRAISVLIVLFCVSVAIILDHTIATPPLDWYDINDRKDYELLDVITYFMYGPYALLLVYLYDKLNPKGLLFTVYIVGWSALAVFFQWLGLLCHVYTYNHWNLVESFAVYLMSTILELKFFDMLMKSYQSTFSNR